MEKTKKTKNGKPPNKGKLAQKGIEKATRAHPQWKERLPHYQKLFGKNPHQSFSKAQVLQIAAELEPPVDLTKFGVYGSGVMSSSEIGKLGGDGLSLETLARENPEHVATVFARSAEEIKEAAKNRIKTDTSDEEGEGSTSADAHDSENESEGESDESSEGHPVDPDELLDPTCPMCEKNGDMEEGKGVECMGNCARWFHYTCLEKAGIVKGCETNIGKVLQWRFNWRCEDCIKEMGEGTYTEEEGIEPLPAYRTFCRSVKKDEEGHWVEDVDIPELGKWRLVAKKSTNVYAENGLSIEGEIGRNEGVAVWYGKEVSDEDMANPKRNNNYLIVRDDGVCLDGCGDPNIGGMGQFVNYSRKPNVKAVTMDEHDGTPIVVLVASRHLKNCELFLKYTWAEDNIVRLWDVHEMMQGLLDKRKY